MKPFWKGAIMGTLVGGVLAFVIALFFKGQETSQSQAALAKVSVEEHFSLKGENMFLKKMLGQFEAEIILLGPVASKSEVQGKVLWDKSMQQGFIHVSGLEPERDYELLLKTTGGIEHRAAHHRSTLGDGGLWQTQFRTVARILDLSAVEIRLLQGETSQSVLARGKHLEN
jgi:hypothetical protein